MNRCVDIAGARILTVDRGRQNEIGQGKEEPCGDTMELKVLV